jgi:ribulose-5-phosphate 4-epimerase/fuculose-1-phosphate aldolase
MSQVLQKPVPVRQRVSEEEWQVRVDLAAAYRLVSLYGMTDMIANHISAAVPGEEGHFLINPYGLLYDEITASNLMKIDLDGKVVDEPELDYGINRAGFVIHSAIHAARHDVGCIIHTHTPAGMAVSALKCGLLPITQTATRWAASPITPSRASRSISTSRRAWSATSAMRR